MRKTLLFSNVQGNINADNSVDSCRFYAEMEKIVSVHIKPHSKLLYVDASFDPSNQERYFLTILECFRKCGVEFDDVQMITSTSTNDVKLDKDTVVFLNGGNPYIQIKTLEKYNLVRAIRRHKNLVIGFCAGAINLCKHSIITTDEDFDVAGSYRGIGRVNVIVEPHFHLDHSMFTFNRLMELQEFSIKFNKRILAMHDEAGIFFDGRKINHYGRVLIIN